MFLRRRQSVSGAGISTRRLEAFSDGVFAIAITLLVLTIAVPELTPEALNRGELLQRLIELWPKFLSFFISFGIIGIFWVGHSIMFHYIKRTNRMLLWINTALLMTVSFIPFPAALLGQYARSQVAVVAYGATLVLAGLAFVVTWLYASSGHRLIDPKLDPATIRLGTTAVFIAPIVYGIATLLSFVHPGISLTIYVLTPLLYIIPSPIDRLVDDMEE